MEPEHMKIIFKGWGRFGRVFPFFFFSPRLITPLLCGNPKGNQKEPLVAPSWGPLKDMARPACRLLLSVVPGL